jgi:hypothetical protein
VSYSLNSTCDFAIQSGSKSRANALNYFAMAAIYDPHTD